MPELIQQHRIRFKREVKILTTALLFLCVNIFAVADQPNSTPPLKKNCFNFSATILNPIVPIIEGQKSGKTETKLDYAVASAKVEKTIQALLDQVLDPKTARNNSDTVVKIKTLPLGPHVRFFEEHIEIKPVFFLTLNWTEKWATTLIKGTAQDPQEYLVSYEKTEGTSHIQHLCGNIILKSLGPQSTWVYLYQELEATRRDANNIMNDLTGTLKTLQQRQSN
jgi:hypothetical protein